MLILPAKDQARIAMEKHQDALEGIKAHYNSEMERILNENSSKEHYWILGKLRFPEELGGKVGRTFLQASDVQPPIVMNAFLYEVDNTRGVKTLLWVTYPDKTMRLPTLGKTISVANTRALPNVSQSYMAKSGRRSNGRKRERK